MSSQRAETGRGLLFQNCAFWQDGQLGLGAFYCSKTLEKVNDGDEVRFLFSVTDRCVTTSGKKHDSFLFPCIIYLGHTRLFSVAIMSEWGERITPHSEGRETSSSGTTLCVMSNWP